MHPGQNVIGFRAGHRGLVAAILDQGRIKPLDDVGVINTELALADLETVERGVQRAEKNSKTGDKDAIKLRDLLKRLRDHLDTGAAARTLIKDPEERKLIRDYQLITYLLQNASGLEMDSIEERMLLWDYKMMRCWYRFTRAAAPGQARQALSEMAAVLAVLGGKLGQRAGVQSEA